MKLNLFSATLAMAVLLMSTSCKKEVKNELAEESISPSISLKDQPAQTGLLKSVRTATSRFHSTTQAIKAGYQADDHCVSVPGLGGMGFHWANPTLVDPVFEPLKPEALLYAPGPDGNLRLVGVEYIVINVGQPRPSFSGQLFDEGGTPIPAPHWSLHVWIHEYNPSGMFMPFNPNVSCQ